MLSFLMLLVVSSCIKSFVPEIRSADKQKYVVVGQVLMGSGLQTVSVSMTSHIDDPQYLPVTGCSVKILDDKGNIFSLNEMNIGNYLTWIDPVFLTPGASFKVEVVTPLGEKINSDYDLLTECPEVDSIYFARKDIPGNNPGQITRGIQFYIELNGTASDSRNYRWEAIETWEYHADYPLEWYFDGTTHHVSPPDYSRNVCWSTTLVQNIFTLSTDNLVVNKYNMFPLHYVSNRTSRLMYGYSLLINQYALSKEAYIYWDQLRLNSSQEGGLYTKQPLPIHGNMHNLTHPEEDVLGYFGATSMKSKRIFIRNVPGLLLDFSTGCSLYRPPFGPESPDEYPIYLVKDGNGNTIYHISEECVNCLLLGGTNVKPDFWPN